MCRSSSPLFGNPVFRRFSRDEFAGRLRLSSAFRQEGMGFEVLMSADAGLDSYEMVELGETSRLSPSDVLVTRASLFVVVARRESIGHEP